MSENQPPKTIWPTLNYEDAVAGIEFLEQAFGFERRLVVPNEADASVVEHSQLSWPEGGGVMIGSAGRPDNPFSQRPTGAGAVYVVTDDVDGVYDRAVAAGAEVFAPLEEHDYGNRGFTVKDPEGNLWSFGYYRGEA